MTSLLARDTQAVKGCLGSPIELQTSFVSLEAKARHLTESSWREFKARICRRNVCLVVTGEWSRSVARRTGWSSWQLMSVCDTLSFSFTLRSWDWPSTFASRSVKLVLFGCSQVVELQQLVIRLRIGVDRCCLTAIAKVSFSSACFGSPYGGLPHYLSDWGWTHLPSHCLRTSSLSRHRRCYFHALTKESRLCSWKASQSEAWSWRRLSCAWLAEGCKIFVASFWVGWFDFSCSVVEDWLGLSCASCFGCHVCP